MDDAGIMNLLFERNVEFPRHARAEVIEEDAVADKRYRTNIFISVCIGALLMSGCMNTGSKEAGELSFEQVIFEDKAYEAISQNMERKKDIFLKSMRRVCGVPWRPE